MHFTVVCFAGGGVCEYDKKKKRQLKPHQREEDILEKKTRNYNIEGSTVVVKTPKHLDLMKMKLNLNVQHLLIATFVI